MSSFSLGNLSFDKPIIQGPLAGFSCAPFRALFYAYTPPAYCVSEMISAKNLISTQKTNGRYLKRAAIEKRLCYQLAGDDVHELATAAKIVEGLGADLIDLNCGCPKTKIRKKKAGSALLEDEKKLYEIVSAMKKAVEVPLTVKIRIDNQTGEKRHLKNAIIIEEAGADGLIVHGRHWTENYEKACDHEAIAETVSSVNIPVIANGDVNDSRSFLQSLHKSKAVAVMVSRAGTGKPWLYRTILENQPAPPLPEIKTLFLQHIKGLIALTSEHVALLEARKLARFYFQDYCSLAKITALHACNKFSELCFQLTDL